MILKTLIVDDEKWGRENLENFLNNYCKDVEVIGKAKSTDEAIQLINLQKPDLVFLDIKMPQKDGFQLLEEINEKEFFVVFVTAYDKYAIKAIKASAVGYLLKPLSIHELVEAVNKVKKLQKAKLENKKILDFYNKSIESLTQNLQPTQILNNILLSNNDGLHEIATQQIIRLEGQDNCTIIHQIEKEPLLFTKTIKYFEEILAETNFMRVHKSYIVNIGHIQLFLKKEGVIKMKDGSEISIARRRQKEFAQKFEEYQKQHPD